MTINALIIRKVKPSHWKIFHPVSGLPLPEIRMTYGKNKLKDVKAVFEKIKHYPWHEITAENARTKEWMQEVINIFKGSK